MGRETWKVPRDSSPFGECLRVSSPVGVSTKGPIPRPDHPRIWFTWGAVPPGVPSQGCLVRCRGVGGWRRRGRGASHGRRPGDRTTRTGPAHPTDHGNQEGRGPTGPDPRPTPRGTLTLGGGWDVRRGPDRVSLEGRDK